MKCQEITIKLKNMQTLKDELDLSIEAKPRHMSKIIEVKKFVQEGLDHLLFLRFGRLNVSELAEFQTSGSGYHEIQKISGTNKLIGILGLDEIAVFDTDKKDFHIFSGLSRIKSIAPYFENKLLLFYGEGKVAVFDPENMTSQPLPFIEEILAKKEKGLVSKSFLHGNHLFLFYRPASKIIPEMIEVNLRSKVIERTEEAPFYGQVLAATSKREILFRDGDEIIFYNIDTRASEEIDIQGLLAETDEADNFINCRRYQLDSTGNFIFAYNQGHVCIIDIANREAPKIIAFCYCADDPAYLISTESIAFDNLQNIYYFYDTEKMQKVKVKKLSPKRNN